MVLWQDCLRNRIHAYPFNGNGRRDDEIRMIVIDHGFEDFFRELDQLVGKEVAVGIHDAEVAEYAAYNEFGTVDVPQRFMRSNF